MKRLATVAFAVASIAPTVAKPFDAAELPSRAPYVQSVNIIDGRDDRDSLLPLGPSLGLSPNEIDRIRKVSGYVGCFLPTPSVGTGALFLTSRQIISVAHIFFTPSGERRSGCF